jgi:hypothetical protein
MTEPNTRISVIIPSYNRANYLPLAVESILAQSYPVTEIIIIDDGSTDNTFEIARSLGDKVHFHTQDHQGVAIARTHGLELARGDIIAWLDADDLWEPNFLASTVPLLENDAKLDGVYTGVTHIDEIGHLLPQSSIKTVPPQQLFSALLEEDFVLTPTVVLRKRCFEEVGSFDPQFQICEDYDMWLRLARRFTLQGIPQSLVQVRVHPDNTLRDTKALIHYRLLIASKHFGAADGDPATWPMDKRWAHAFALRDAALVEIQADHIQQGWNYLERAVIIWPDLLAGPRTFYELALGNQSRGQRGQIEQQQLQRNSGEMLQRLERLFDHAGEKLQRMRSIAFGNAYLALGMLFERAEDWQTARTYLWKAVRTCPRLGTDITVLRRGLKLTMGPQLVRTLRGLRG